MRKRLLLAVFFCVFLSSSAVAEYNYQRTNAPLPVIGGVVAEIKSATGWAKNSAGQWVSCKNSINPYGDKLGSDNFTLLQIRTVQIGSEQYYLLIRQCTTGGYTYPSIRAGLHYSDKAFFFVFAKDDRDKVAVANDIPIEPLLIKFKPLYCDEVLSYTYSSEDKDFLARIRDELQGLVATNNMYNYISDDARIVFNVLPIRKENRCFFVMSGTEMSLFSMMSNQSSPDVFQKNYYEVTFDVFNSFIPLIKQ